MLTHLRFFMRPQFRRGATTSIPLLATQTLSASRFLATPRPTHIRSPLRREIRDNNHPHQLLKRMKMLQADGRANDFLKTFELLREKWNLPMTERGYRFLFESVAKQRNAPDLRQYLDEIIEAREIPSHPKSFEALIAALPVLGKLDLMEFYLSQMKVKNLPVTDSIYLSVISAFAKSGNEEKMLHYLGQMKASSPSITALPYNIVLEYYAEKRAPLEKVKKLVEEMKAQNIIFTEQTYNFIIAACSAHGDLESAFFYQGKLNELSSPSTPLLDTYLSKMRDFADAHNWQGVINTFDDLQVTHGIVSSVAYNELFSLLGKLDRLDHIRFYFRQMKQKQVPVSTQTYLNLMNAFSKKAKYEKVLEYYEEMTNMQVHMDNPDCANLALAAAWSLQRLYTMQAILRTLKDRRIAPDLMTINLKISLLSALGHVEEVKQEFEFIKAKGWKPNKFTFQGIVSALSKKGYLKELLSFLDEIKSSDFVMSATVYVALLHAYLNENDWKKFEHNYEQLKKLKVVNPSVFAALMKGAITFNRREFLDSVLQDMEELDFKPTNVMAKKALMEAYIFFDEIPAAIKLLQEHQVPWPALLAYTFLNLVDPSKMPINTRNEFLYLRETIYNPKQDKNRALSKIFRERLQELFQAYFNIKKRAAQKY